MRINNLTSLETIKKVVTVSGTPEVLCPKQSAITIAFTNNAATAARDTLTDSASQFLVEGFRAGDKIDITGSTSNNVQVEVYSVTAGTITITKSGYLTTEAEGDTVVLDLTHGRKVEDGVGVLIMANTTNTGTITLGSTSARALNTNSNYDSYFPLLAGQSIGVQVRNLKDVWMDATVSGDGVSIGFER